MRFQIKHQNIIGKSKERERDSMSKWLKTTVCKITSNLLWAKRWASGKMEKKQEKSITYTKHQHQSPFSSSRKNSKVKRSKSKTIWPLLGRTEKTENDFSVISRGRKTKAHMTHNKEAGKSKRMQNITFLLLLLPKKLKCVTWTLLNKQEQKDYLFLAGFQTNSRGAAAAKKEENENVESQSGPNKLAITLYSLLLLM